MTNFYCDIKKWISPSAFAQWHYQRSQFIRSYFAGEKSPETAAMKAGKRFHAMIEAGLLPVTHRFDANEVELRVGVLDEKGEHAVQVFGKPDSCMTINHTPLGVTSRFCDYKTGKENLWTSEKLAGDLKMLLTAWLVWQDNGQPNAGMKGIIEFIATEWDGTELVPMNAPHEFVEHHYTSEQLRGVRDMILKTVADVNAEYPKWLEASGDFVSEGDCRAYAELEAQKKEIEGKQKELKERIGEQLGFGGARTHESDWGTFYVTERKVFEYPKDLKARVGDLEFTLQHADDIELAMSVVKKNYELTAVPKTVSRSLGFRAKKK